MRLIYETDGETLSHPCALEIMRTLHCGKGVLRQRDSRSYEFSEISPATMWESRLPLMDFTLLGAREKMHAQSLVLISVGLPPNLWSHVLVADAGINDIFQCRDILPSLSKPSFFLPFL